MRILIAEYAVAVDKSRSSSILREGKSILSTLVTSFTRCGHEVVYPSAGIKIGAGTPLNCDDESFEYVIEQESGRCDFGLLIAPDHLLAKYTRLLAENTTNLGCTPDTIELCSDKLECTRTLARNGINVPKIYSTGDSGQCVIKPRYGCASENTILSKTPVIETDRICTEYISGDNLSVSMIASNNNSLSLAVNRQMMEIDPNSHEFKYNGCLTPISSSMNQELFNISSTISSIMGCNGYIGIDFIVNEDGVIYVLDINPRPTTSLVGICAVMEEEIGELLLNSIHETLPNKVNFNGQHLLKIEDI
ncbi:ATP-grasp domain-containing protein [Methanosalsum natronophilum]|uniref:ATP-grasp domain-containing protein n=1 Tax=Methanosalsum natronophilum TaxID=768733 RepID=A0A424Z510_9EURY|nr:ATP-grasp domain-containing protein [Methanosalsum natronophilum]MCS3923217.1 putative ATP-grasp superfamily ATP-dependent carboligase [Methanosalsum natronophilum]RQD92235.1 MAG: ATP-grasp domain-containing protein [Methanosalsum natronophilum]